MELSADALSAAPLAISLHSRVWPIWLLGLALASLASCSRPGSEEPAQRPRVVVLALDGATWDLLDPFMKRGLLPNLKSLRDAGTSGPLQSIQPSSSPVIWTTIATGKTPQKHGITFFVRFPDGKLGDPKPVSSTLRKTKAIWNVLSEAGRDVAMVGWFVTWPVESVHGRMISDRAHYGRIDRSTFPPAYLTSLAVPSPAEAAAAVPRFMRFTYDAGAAPTPSDDPEEHLRYLVFDRFVRAYSRDLFYLRSAEHVLQDGRLPEFLAVYLRGTDDVQHGFWKFMNPEPFGKVAADQIARFGEVIERYWQWTDEAVGKILSYYDEDTLVLVLSDHGAGPAVGEYAVSTKKYLHLSGAHRDEGILIASGPGVRRGAAIEGASVFDITPTLLYYMGLAVGRDMDGKVLMDLFDADFAQRPVELIATYDDEESSGSVAEPDSSAADPEILDHLRSLGYID